MFKASLLHYTLLQRYQRNNDNNSEATMRRSVCTGYELIWGVQSRKNSTPLRIHTRRRASRIQKEETKASLANHPVSLILVFVPVLPFFTVIFAAFRAQRGRAMSTECTVRAHFQRNNRLEIKNVAVKSWHVSPYTFRVKCLSWFSLSPVADLMVCSRLAFFCSLFSHALQLSVCLFGYAVIEKCDRLIHSLE